MKRQKDGMQSLVYAYGAVAPIDSQVVMAEVYRQWDMWDALVNASRDHDRRMDTYFREVSPEYVAACESLDSAWDNLREKIEARNARRSESRAKTTDKDEDVREAVKKRNEARTAHRNILNTLRKTHKDAMKESEVMRKQDNTRIRQESGLYWGNYNRVLDDFETARQACMKLGRNVQHIDRSRKDGVLTYQIQRTRTGLGAAPSELHDQSINGIQISPVSAESFMLPRAARTKAVQTKFRMRVDNDGNAIETLVWFHRPLPPDVRVKKAQLCWKSEGEKYKGKLCLTISQPRQTVTHAGVSAAGIDLGWRKQPDGSLLVATISDTTGRTERLTLSPQWISRMDQAERIQGYIDDNLLDVAAYIHANKDTLPNALSMPTARWKPGMGSRNLNATELHDAVRSLNWNVPEEILHWYKRYRHLYTFMTSLRAKARRNRKETYRLFSKKIGASYAYIGLEDMDISKMARTKKRDDAEDNELRKEARANRVRACVHELRSELIHQARKHGTEIHMATSLTTMRCRECGGVTEQADREQRIWTCEHCSAKWDQDANASKNLLAVAVKNATGVIELPSDGIKGAEHHPIKRTKHHSPEACPIAVGL